MSAKKRTKIALLITIFCFLPKAFCAGDNVHVTQNSPSLTREAIAKELGWVDSRGSICGGYYLEAPFPYSDELTNNNVEITSNQGFLALRGTSVLEKEVTITRQGQQITANRAFLYRDPITWKLSSTDMIGDVHLREPNTLVIGRRAHYDFQTTTKSFIDIIYRTGLYNTVQRVPEAETHTERKITTLTAWGSAYEFSQTLPKVYEFTSSTYSTCPPINPSWEVKAGRIVLNKNTGRGYAKHARLYIKDIPVLYMPYIDFSIDKQRKTGFLWPTIGLRNGKWGPNFFTPFYWNMAPNYDMTLTPGILAKRGFMFTDDFRYLSSTSKGDINFSIIPHDIAFHQLQIDTANDPKYSESKNTSIQADLVRLETDSTFRRAFFWRDDSQFNDNWSSHVDVNYASDDYYLKDFGSNLNETTANQLLEEADLYFKSQHWNFTGRFQGYQTLHPIMDPQVQNNYIRFPQLILSADYPDQAFGLEYFISNEITHFDIRNTPGIKNNLPIGNRLNIQPGISWPFSVPYFFITPRLQVAMTKYFLYQTSFTNQEAVLQRVLPIFDIASGLALSRDAHLFGQVYEQTLEPQVYYTYIPYRSQNWGEHSIPIFDTTVSTLVYDQLFTYNRFSGIDRIGDANQISLGITMRLIDQLSGLEKVRLGVGEIIYFTDRRVTFCTNNSCDDNPSNPNNHYSLSPLTAVLNYHVNPSWNFTVNGIWNTIRRQLDNSSINIHYQPDEDRIINLGFTFARNGDYFSGINVNSSQNNLKLTDISFAWPLMNNISAVGRWTEDWNTRHFQNILYGLQYDTCCWSIRFVGGKTFTGLDENRSPEYNPAYYVQFDLKGLGNIGNDPSSLLNTVGGYKNKFGQEYIK